MPKIVGIDNKLYNEEKFLSVILANTSKDACYIGIFDMYAKNEYDIRHVYLCYDPNPPNKEHCNFFGYYRSSHYWYVTGFKDFDGMITGIYYEPTDEILVSTSVHSMVMSEDEKCYIDGGPYYTRVGGTCDFDCTIQVDLKKIREDMTYEHV
ncbi:MAG: hypothetical protein DSY80_04975 [Desulfocapsa sp.]|nr:MAG: hypothetical protein DSY80_04975 [Desulfocapsa sp.]